MKVRLLVLALLALLVAACAPAPPELRSDNLLHNPSLITGEPCAPPCWNGITPGETSFNEALTILEDDPDMTNVETQTDDSSDARGVTWQEGDDGQPCCQLVSEDGETVSSMLLHTAPDVMVSEVIDRYGEPEYVTGQPVSDDQALMLMLYPDVPIIVYAFVAGEQEGELAPSSEIVATFYLMPPAMEEVLTNNDLYFWEGYQSFSAYIDEDYDRTAVPTAEGGDNDDTSDE